MMKMQRLYLAMLLAAPLVAAAQANAATPTWKPEQHVELVVPNAAGGGNDRFTRLIAKIAQEHRYVDVPITVVNKPGGGGSIGLTYLNEHPGNGNYLSIISATFLGTSLLGHNKIGPDSITPVAQLLTEYLGFAVRPDSSLKSGADLVARLKANPASVSTAISGTPGNHNYVALMLAARAAGADLGRLKIVYFSGGGESTTAALGGHVDLLVAPASTILPYVRDGRLRFLAITAPRRLGGPYADVPTWREQGIDVTTANWRAMVGPRGMTAAQTAYWDRVLKQVVDSSEWKAMVERSQLTPEFLPSAAMRKALDAEFADMKSLLTQLGLIKP
jgi:putative tricarboxylic transport membrane protein